MGSANMDSDEHCARGHRDLWRCVFLRAIMDALGNASTGTGHAERAAIVAEAQTWLSDPKAVEEVADLAGIETVVAQRMASAVLRVRSA